MGGERVRAYAFEKLLRVRSDSAASEGGNLPMHASRVWLHVTWTRHMPHYMTVMSCRANTYGNMPDTEGVYGVFCAVPPIIIVDTPDPSKSGMECINAFVDDILHGIITTESQVRLG